MRVPVEWLRDYVAVPKEARGVDVAASLVRVGLEEEGLHGGQVTGPLVVGKVLTREPEEQKNGKTINWCTVDVGSANGTGEPQGIVCGAHNFEVGDLVVVVLPGAELPGGFAISARKTYGHISDGMICAADELGLPDDGSGGIMRLDELFPGRDLAAGEDAISLLGLDRETVEINVTPDRGYCFSLRGVAREYSHATGAEFTDPASALAERAPAGNGTGYEVRLEDDAPLRGRDGCDRYVARIVRGIDLSASTPAWMATRLTEAGMRPISLAVDITNYVMLALGQPLHAFDVMTLRGPIVVRRAREGEKLTTLDDVARSLYPEDLLITDSGDTPLAIAGVMGGEESEVSTSTTDVLIESAHFDATSVARSSRRHKLPSEAARRFERGVDPQVAPAAAQFAVDLLVELGGGVADDGVTDAGSPTRPSPITLDVAHPGRLVGVDYDRECVTGVLTRIGCHLEGAGAQLSVTPPSWRPDLTGPEDLVEEIARIEGYARIPSVLPTPPGGRGLTHGQHARRIVANVLAGQGLSEVWTAPFVSDTRHEQMGWPADAARARTVRIANPLSEEEPLMRISLLSTMTDTVRRNVSRGHKDVAIFELGLVLARDGEQVSPPSSPVGVLPSPEDLAQIRASVPAQPRHLGIVLTGDREPAGWWGQGRGAEWSDAIEIARSVAEALAVDVVAHADDVMPFHPGRCARLEFSDGSVFGHAGELHPKVCQALGLPPRVVGCELDVDALIAAADSTVRSHPIGTYPQVQSDIALIVDREVTAGETEAALRDGAGELLEDITLFDCYQGDQLGEGQKSLAYRLTFRALDRTLTTKEVNRLRDAAVDAAAQATGATQRVG